MKREAIAWVLIISSLVAAELIAWGFTHNWFNSVFAGMNALAGAIIAVIAFIFGCMIFADEAR